MQTIKLKTIKYKPREPVSNHLTAEIEKCGNDAKALRDVQDTWDNNVRWASNDRCRKKMAHAPTIR